MTTLHEELATSNKAYATWHRQPMHMLAHWAIFTAVSFVVTSALLASINQTFAEGVQASNIRGSVTTARSPQAVAFHESVSDHVFLSFRPGISQVDQAALLVREGLTMQAGRAPQGLVRATISENDTPEEVVQRLLVLEKQYVVAAVTDPI